MSVRAAAEEAAARHIQLGEPDDAISDIERAAMLAAALLTGGAGDDAPPRRPLLKLRDHCSRRLRGLMNGQIAFIGHGPEEAPGQGCRGRGRMEGCDDAADLLSARRRGHNVETDGVAGPAGEPSRATGLEKRYQKRWQRAKAEEGSTPLK